MNEWFWVWVLLAVVFSVAEIFTGGFFVLPFGVGAACAAALEFFGIGIGWQWAAFLGVSVVVLVLARRLSNLVTHDAPQSVAGNRLIGKTGVVVEEIAAHHPRGTVRVEREEWRADAPGHEPLEVGMSVRVVRVEGTHLVVEPADAPVQS